MRLSVIGLGRLGRSLAVLWEQEGHEVELLGRGRVPDRPDVIVLAVPDSALSEAAGVAHRAHGRPVLLHCSGAQPVSVLRPHEPAGSLHPLMTFPGPEIALPDLQGVPAAIEGDPDAVTVAERLATGLGMTPLRLPGDRRLYHAAAVMAGNFATVLLAEAATVLAAAGIPPERAPALLVPLAVASLENAGMGPSVALTGPAARGDAATIEQHLQALEAHGLRAQRRLYDRLTERAAALAGVSLERDVR